MFLVIVFASFIFGMLIGRYKLVTVLINIYVAVALLSVLPEKLFSDYYYRLILFFAIIAGLTFLGKKMFEVPIFGSGKSFLWRVFAMSFLEVMLALSMALSIAPKKEALNYISLTSYNYFVSENALIFWMLAPLVFMFIIRKKVSR